MRTKKYFDTLNHNGHLIWLILFGIAGWSTDAFIGRYKVIRCSVWIMWILMIAVMVSAVIRQLNETYYYYNKTIINSVYCSVCKYWPGWISSQYSSFRTSSAPRCFNNLNQVLHNLVCKHSNRCWIYCRLQFLLSKWTTQTLPIL